MSTKSDNNIWKKSIFKIPLVALFGNLQEHEIELDWLERYKLDHDRLEKHEGREIKVKSLSFKSKHDSDQEKGSQYEDHEYDALIKKLKILKRGKDKGNEWKRSINFKK